jgi:prophage regulatory protein
MSSSADTGSPSAGYRGQSTPNHNAPPNGPGRKYLRLPAVLDRTGLKKTTIYALQKTGSFPRNYPLSANAVGWLEAEVEAWLASRGDARAQQGPISPVIQSR